jgi:hypothetical protein
VNHHRRVWTPLFFLLFFFFFNFCMHVIGFVLPSPPLEFARFLLSRIFVPITMRRFAAGCHGFRCLSSAKQFLCVWQSGRRSTRDPIERTQGQPMPADIASPTGPPSLVSKTQKEQSRLRERQCRQSSDSAAASLLPLEFQKPRPLPLLLLGPSK